MKKLIDKILFKFGYIKVTSVSNKIDISEYSVVPIRSVFRLSLYQHMKFNSVAEKGKLKKLVSDKLAEEISKNVGKYINVLEQAPQIDSFYTYTGSLNVLVPKNKTISK